MPRFKFGKLVRDKIVEQQLASGSKPVYRKLGDQKHKEALVDKIIEEAKEITQTDPEHVAAEIADVQQALDDLVKLFGLKKIDISKAQTSKQARNGAFLKGLFIDYVDVDAKDKWVKYYRENADRYPEIDKD